jgi:hypothetical protein
MTRGPDSMSRVRAAAAHEVPDRRPLKIAVGEAVRLGDRDTTWPAFVFVTTDHGEGWVPARHLEISSGGTIVAVAYDTTELATTAGEELEILERDDESGWLWCRNHDGVEGWIPIDTVEPAE